MFNLKPELIIFAVTLMVFITTFAMMTLALFEREYTDFFFALIMVIIIGRIMYEGLQNNTPWK